MSTLQKEVAQTMTDAGTKISRRILDRLILRRREPEVRWKIVNLTRSVALAERAEVADRGAKRSKGLLGRNGLEPGEGMWIVPCEAVHTFGMRFPIDLVYVDSKKRVKKVRSGVTPWRLSACLSAHSVIELAVGAIRASNTEPGDILEFSPVGPLTENTEGIHLCTPAPHPESEPVGSLDDICTSRAGDLEK